MSLPTVTAVDANNIEVAAGDAGNAGMIELQLATAMEKNLGENFAAGGTEGACDVGSKGANQTWNIFLIGVQLSPINPAPQSALAALSLSRASNVATLTAPDHPLGVGGTLVIGGPNGAFAGFEGAFAITAVTEDTITFANDGPDFSADELATVTWGYPVVSGFDVLASQSADPDMPEGFSLAVPIATVTTDSGGNIASIGPA